MDCPKLLSSDEILNIIQDQDSKNSFVNKELMAYKAKRNILSKELIQLDIPHVYIRNFVQSFGEQVLSQFSEEERISLTWEHVGSTSIPGMPGTRNPDVLLMYDDFPPSKKIIDVITSCSFHFWMTAKHIDQNDLWFLHFLPDDECFKGNYVLLHLVNRDCMAGKYLLGLRDLCRNEQWAFNEYKTLKIAASDNAKHLQDYKQSKDKGFNENLKQALEKYIQSKEN